MTFESSFDANPFTSDTTSPSSSHNPNSIVKSTSNAAVIPIVNKENIIPHAAKNEKFVKRSSENADASREGGGTQVTKTENSEMEGNKSKDERKEVDLGQDTNAAQCCFQSNTASRSSSQQKSNPDVASSTSGSAPISKRSHPLSPSTESNHPNQNSPRQAADSAQAMDIDDVVLPVSQPKASSNDIHRESQPHLTSSPAATIAPRTGDRSSHDPLTNPAKRQKPVLAPPPSKVPARSLNPDHPAGDTAVRRFLLAVSTGRVAEVVAFTQRYSVRGIRGSHGRTCAMLSAMNGNMPVFRALEKLPVADLELYSKDSDKNTCVHLAATRPGTLEALMRMAPPLVNWVNKDGDLPIHIAASAGNLKCVQLLASCSNLGLKNKRKETPLDAARRGERCKAPQSTKKMVIDQCVAAITSELNRLKSSHAHNVRQPMVEASSRKRKSPTPTSLPHASAQQMIGASTANPSEPPHKKRRIDDPAPPIVLSLQDVTYENIELLWEGMRPKAAASSTLIGRNSSVEKDFVRSSADTHPSEDTVRPLDVLKKAFALLEQRFEAGSDYNYLKNQFKSIRQDLTAQHIVNEFTAQVYETHARLALINGDRAEFNPCLVHVVSLHKSTQSLHKKEFQVYHLVCSTLSRDPSCHLLARDLDASDECHAACLSALRAYASQNMRQFFAMCAHIEQKQYWLLHLVFGLYLDDIRVRFLHVMAKAHLKTPLSPNFLMSNLSLKKSRAIKSFLDRMKISPPAREFTGEELLKILKDARALRQGDTVVTNVSVGAQEK